MVWAVPGVGVILISRALVAAPAKIVRQEAEVGAAI